MCDFGSFLWYFGCRVGYSLPSCVNFIKKQERNIIQIFEIASLVNVSGHYSEVPNRRADRNKQAGLEKSGTLLANLLSKLINDQGGIVHFTK